MVNLFAQRLLRAVQQIKSAGSALRLFALSVIALSTFNNAFAILVTIEPSNPKPGEEVFVRIIGDDPKVECNFTVLPSTRVGNTITIEISGQIVFAGVPGGCDTRQELGVLPEGNYLVIVNREFNGVTPGAIVRVNFSVSAFQTTNVPFASPLTLVLFGLAIAAVSGFYLSRKRIGKVTQLGITGLTAGFALLVLAGGGKLMQPIRMNLQPTAKRLYC
jgi:hypothetical protein